MGCTHRLVVQSELLLGHKADVQFVVVQVDIVSGETVAGVKPATSVFRVRHNYLLTDTQAYNRSISTIEAVY